MTLIEENEETKAIVLRMRTGLLRMLEDFMRGHRSFLVLGSEKKWYGTRVSKPDGEWDRAAEDMMLNFAESGHPVFRASSALERGEFKSKGKGIKSIHFDGCDDTVKLDHDVLLPILQGQAHQPPGTGVLDQPPQANHT